MVHAGVKTPSKVAVPAVEARRPAAISAIKKRYLRKCLESLLLIPLFPLLGYGLLDQTGVSAALLQAGLIPAPVLGEGFGHVGLCFSLHYLINAARYLRKALA